MARAEAPANFVHQTVDPAFAIGEGLRILAVNEAAERVFGVRAADAVGAPCSSFVCAMDATGRHVCQDDCPAFARFLSGEPVRLDWREWVTPQGGRVPITAIAITPPANARTDQTVALVIVHPGAGAGGPAPSSGAAGLAVQFLGTTAVMRGDGQALQPRRRKSLEVLALLALADGHRVHRDELLEALWPAEPPALTAPRLRVLLHDLRRLLERGGAASVLQREGAGYALHPGTALTVDAVEFERVAREAQRAPQDAATTLPLLEHALALYGGEFAGGEHFGVWAIPHQERLRQRFHDVLAAAALRYVARGAIELSVECCERALRSDPLQEQFIIALIACYVRMGRRADALRQYEDYRRLLAADGIRPPEATERDLRRAFGSL